MSEDTLVAKSGFHTMNVSMNVSMNECMYESRNESIYLIISLSLSLSLYIYIYIYITPRLSNSVTFVHDLTLFSIKFTSI